MAFHVGLRFPRHPPPCRSLLLPTAPILLRPLLRHVPLLGRLHPYPSAPPPRLPRHHHSPHALGAPPGMFNGKFPFPPSREAWEISHGSGISRGMGDSQDTGNSPEILREIPISREIPGKFPGFLLISEISHASGNSRNSGISQDMGNSRTSGIPEVQKSPARFPGNGKFPGISRPRLPVEHRCAPLHTSPDLPPPPYPHLPRALRPCPRPPRSPQPTPTATPRHPDLLHHLLLQRQLTHHCPPPRVGSCSGTAPTCPAVPALALPSATKTALPPSPSPLPVHARNATRTKALGPPIAALLLSTLLTMSHYNFIDATADSLWTCLPGQTSPANLSPLPLP